MTLKGSNENNEESHDHDFNRVHEAQLHDTHEFAYVMAENFIIFYKIKLNSEA